MTRMDPAVQADLDAGRRYVASNEDAYEHWCEVTGRDPLADNDAAWCALSDAELDEYVFPVVPEHLR